MEVIVIDDEEYYFDADTDDLIKINPDSKKEKSNSNPDFDSDEIDEIDEIDKIDQTNQTDKSEQKQKDEEIWYPKKPDIDLWESFLNRELTVKEKEIILDVVLEKELNNCIKGLQQNLLGHNCFITELTNSNGNCLFESLGKLGLGDNDLNIEPHKMLRLNISSILLYMRSNKDFFPNLNISPEEIFNSSNEIEFLKHKETGEVYEYNYDMMICDLRTNYSWKRLPTELILMSISRIYQIKILIYHNKSSYVNEINVWKSTEIEDQVDTFRLGHINEEHYLPVNILPNELIDDIETIHTISKIKLKYDTKKTNYKYWAQNTAFNMLVDGFDYDKKDNQLTNQISNQPINHLGNQKGKNNILDENTVFKIKIVDKSGSKSNKSEKMNLDEFEFL